MPHSRGLVTGTIITSFGGALLSEIVQSTGISVGAVAASCVGLVTLWVNKHYELQKQKLDSARLRSENMALRILLEKIGGKELPDVNITPFP